MNVTTSEVEEVSKLSSILATIIVTVFGLLLALAAVEAVVRMLPARKQMWSDRPNYYLKDPKARTTQDYAYPLEKPEGTYRIAVIGDSFTFATQMQFEDSFPKVLERMLKLNTNGKAVEVLNFGVPGYSTTHEVGAFRHIRKYSPDMILLQITLNDPQLKPYVPTGITGQNEFGAVSADGLNGLSRYWKTWAFIQMRLHNTRTHTRYKTYYHQLFSTNSQTYRNFQEALDSLSKKAAKQNIAVAAVVFPLFGLPLNDSYPFEDIHEKIASDLERSKIAYLDLLDAYKGIPLERLQLIPGVDFHPNEIGHRIAAERIYEWFHQEKSIPQDLTESERFRDRLNIVPEKNNPVS